MCYGIIRIMTQLVTNVFEISPPDIEKVVAEQSMIHNVDALRKTIDEANKLGDYSSAAPRQVFTVLSMEEAFGETGSQMLSGNATIANSVCLSAISAVFKQALDNGFSGLASEIIKIAEYRHIGLEAGGIDSVELDAELERHRGDLAALMVKQTKPSATNSLGLSKLSLN